MKKYVVHFSGYYGYNVEVEANSEEEAIELAEPIFNEIDPSDYDYEPSREDVWEEK